jgi:hypothetical protein
MKKLPFCTANEPKKPNKHKIKAKTEGNGGTC